MSASVNLLDDTKIYVNNIKNSITNIPTNIKTALTSSFDSVKNAVTGLPESIRLKFDGFVDSINNNVTAFKTSVTTLFSTLQTAITDKIDSFKSSVENVINSVKTSVNDVKTAVTSLFDFVKSIPTLIIDGLKTLFIPSDTYLDNKFNTLKTTFNTKINATNYIDAVDKLKNAQNGKFSDFKVNIMGVEATVINAQPVNDSLVYIHSWVRGVLVILLILYNYSQIYRLIRGSSYIDAGKSAIGGVSGDN